MDIFLFLGDYKGVGLCLCVFMFLCNYVEKVEVF